MPDIETKLPADKVVHFVEYGILGFLLFRALTSTCKVSGKWTAILAICCAVALGALDESYQALTGRNKSLYDWLADCLGATTAALCCLGMYEKVQKTVVNKYQQML